MVGAVPTSVNVRKMQTATNLLVVNCLRPERYPPNML